MVIKTASISILFTEANFGPGLPSGSKGNINIEVGSPNQLNKKKEREKRMTYLLTIVAKSDKTSDSLASGTFLA